MFKITSPKDNAVSATYQYLKAIGAKVTESTVEETLKDHPDYPSILAISDALNEWNIENIVIQIKPEQLTEPPTPFLTYLSTNGGIFALVTSLKDNTIDWIHTKEGVKREKIDNFLTKWNGLVLMAETNEASGEKNYTEKHKIEIISNIRIPLLIAGTTSLIISLFYCNFNSDWQYNALLLTKFAGTIVSSLLLWQSIDKNNPFIKNLCHVGGKKSDCNTIIHSKAAQITQWLNWSEVGFFYFAGGFITLLGIEKSVSLASSEGMKIINLLNVLAIGYSFWSVYYQGFIAKHWCSLCLIIQGLIIMEFGISLSSTIQWPNILFFSFNDILHFSLGTGVAVLLWIFLKPILLKSQQVEPLKNGLRRFKNNPDLFSSLLEKQEEMLFVPNHLSPVLIGNPNAKHTIVMVTNPLCQPCAKIHKIIENLLETNENLNCKLIFAASNKDRDKRGMVARSILSLPESKQGEALSEWFKNEERNFEKWQKQFDIVENEKSIEIIEQHLDWCKTAKVEGTPTLYLDGFKMPELYQLQDLKGILKYLQKTVA